jgi:hypothetical protein
VGDGDGGGEGGVEGGGGGDCEGGGGDGGGVWGNGREGGGEGGGGVGGGGAGGLLGGDGETVSRDAGPVRVNAYTQVGFSTLVPVILVAVGSAINVSVPVLLHVSLPLA